MFDQPELERLLRANLARYPSVTLRGNAEVTGLVQDGAGHVRVDLVDRTTGEAETLLADYVLGCDGANSLTRTAIGSGVHDLNFEQRWLVVDIDTKVELDQWEGVHQVCDTRRAATYMRVGDTRYRWEFRLGDDETAEDYRDLARLHPLLAPWTGHVPDDQLEIVRVAEYTFRAQIADRWRDRRIFLLGDAAHLTPPFVGQGMGAGLRDAANLSWKLAGVLHNTLPESALATYETERIPHARAMIRLAKLVGTAMTAGGEVGNLLRRVLAPRLHHVPGVKRLVLDGETPPLRRSALVARPRLRRGLAGRLCPNPQLDDGHRLDDLTAGHFAIITRIEPTTAQRADIEHRGAVLLVARPGSELDSWLRRGRARAAIIRPDGTVLRAGRNLDALSRTLPGAPRPGPTRRSENPDVRTSDRGNPPPAPTAVSDTSYHRSATRKEAPKWHCPSRSLRAARAKEAEDKFLAAHTIRGPSSRRRSTRCGPRPRSATPSSGHGPTKPSPKCRPGGATSRSSGTSRSSKCGPT